MECFQLANKMIGKANPIFIIAEVGVNHNGNVDIAIELIRKAKACGADCVKFQTFKAEHIVTNKSPKADYQLKTTNPVESQFDMLKKFELSDGSYQELIRICKEEDIIFMSTPYNLEDIDFLANFGVPAFKVASGQAVEPFFLKYMAKKNKPVLLSTGMCTLSEVDEAVRTIREAGNNQLVLLQCTTNYPSAIEDTNLYAMAAMRDAFDVLVGYSDHTEGLTASIAAAALGASVIERHFTLDKSMPGPDHSSSSDPLEFTQLVKHIRDTERCLGSAVKKPSSAETINAVAMRRSIVASRDISVGSLLTIDNVTLKRPASGLLGNQIAYILGRKAAIEIKAETPIDFGMIQ
ncbi:N-acetylneuraminate synthase [bacterium]|nr:N-acetylneuraminate synthase [bacterium]